MQKQKFNPRKLIKPLIIIAIIGAIGFGGYTVFKYFQESQRMAMMAQFAGRTQIERAEKSDIKELVSASGVIALNNEESIYGANGERVSEVLVEVGDIVEKDQIIVYYDIEDKRDELEKQIQQAEINLRNQELSLKSMVAPVGESELRQLQTGVDSSDKSLYDAQNTVASTEIKIEDQREAISRAQEDVIKAQQDIDKAQSDIDEAEEEKSKQQQLLNVDGISLDEFKQYEKAVETANDAKVKAEDAKVTAELAVTNAQNTLRDLERTLESNQKSVTSAEQNLKNAELNLSEATITLKDEADRINYEKQQNQITLTQLDLEDYRKQLEDITENTTTPLAGTVTSVGVSRGKTVDASTVLVTIADFNDLIVTADISEYDIPKLAIGQPVAMTSDGIADATYTGKVTKIGDSAVSASASSGTSTTVPVEIAFDTVPKDLKPGFNLELEITVNHNPEAVTVSITAVKKDAITGERKVFTVDEQGILSEKLVKTGIVSDMVVEIASGVNEGDQVVTSPTDTMEDGMNINEAGGGVSGDGAQQGGFGAMGGGIRVGGGGGVMQQSRPAGGGRTSSSSRP